MVRATATDFARVYGTQWRRLALVQLLVLVAVMTVVGVVALIVQSSGDDLLAWIASDLDSLTSRAALVASLGFVGIALLTLPFQLIGFVLTVRIADRALAGERGGMRRALREAAGRAIPALGALALAVAAVLLAVVAAPLIVVAAILGLAVTGILALVRRRRPAAAPAWPSVRVWLFLAIPFAALWWVAAPAALAPVIPALEKVGPVGAVRRAVHAARGRRWVILALWLVALALAVALSGLSALLGSAVAGEAGAAIVGGLVQLVVVPVPLVAAVVLYRRSADPNSRASGGVVIEPPKRSRPLASPAMARTAIVTVVTLVATLGLAVTPAALPALADASVAGQTVTYVVTSSADTDDPGVIAAQSASCLAGGPDCTIRASLSLAQQDAADGAVGVTILFASAMEIPLVGTLGFAPDALPGSGGPDPEDPIEDPVEDPVEDPIEGEDIPEEGEDIPEEGEDIPEEGGGEEPPASTPSAIVAGLLTIDTQGQRVVLDGGAMNQILTLTSEYWNLGVSGVTFRNGWSDFGAALSSGVPVTTLTRTVFDTNTSMIGAGAVFARQLDVSSSTFINNRASGYTASTFGGAIRTTGRATILNSSFGGNSIGDQYSTPVNQGSDVYAGSGMDVLNSTFVNSRGGSLVSAAGVSTIRNSLFTTDFTSGGLMCAGTFEGGNNLSAEADGTCPGAGTRAPVPVVGALDSGGPVPVFPLTLSGNPAIGAGADCPATDAWAAPRAAMGCDLGAVEFAGATSIDLRVTPSPTVFATATFRATVTSETGATPQGYLTFSVDGQTYGPFGLDGSGSAELELSDLEAGVPLAYSAHFDAIAPYDPSDAGPLSYTVEQVPVDVAITCADPTSAPCTGSPWVFTDSGTIDVVVAVDDDRAGTVALATDAAGASLVAGPDAIDGGPITFSLDASELGVGAHELWAIYESDDEEHAGRISQPVVIRLTPTVVLDAPASTGVFGDPAAGTVTVTVTGAGPTPTGTVTVLGRTATLDASGVATIDMSRTPVYLGAAELVASYSGDDAYGSAESNAASYETTIAGTTTEITTVAPQNPAYGQDVTVTVTVTADAPSLADPRNRVSLLVDGTELFGPVIFAADENDGDGIHRYDITIPSGALTTGEHSVIAQFGGSGDFVDSESSALDLTIAPAPTTTTLDVAPSPAAWGDQVELTATVIATTTTDSPTGLIEFTVGGASLGTAALAPCPSPAEGCSIASLTVSAASIGVGPVVLTAAYAGAADFAASTAEVAGTAVVPADTVVTVSGPTTLAYGVERTWTITVGTDLASPADGTSVAVTAVREGGESIDLGTVALVDGAGSIAVPTAGVFLPGDYEIVAVFAGDARFTAASGSSPLTVVAATTDIDLISLTDTTVTYGGLIGTTITVKNTTGATFPDGDVVVRWGGAEVGRVTLSASHDTATPGVRRVTLDAVLGVPLYGPGEDWFTAEFVAAPGFLDSRLQNDQPEERRRVTVTAMEAEVSLDMVAVIGDDLEATATVAIMGESSGVVPKGFVTFMVTKSGAGQIGPIGPVAVVDGTAELPAGILVDIGGSWIVRATYVKDDVDPRYVVTIPHNVASAQVDLNPASALVEVDAPLAVGVGEPLVIAVNVRGATTPTGTVRLQLAGTGNVVLSDEVALVDGRAEITTTLPPLMALGDHDFAVWYSGDGALDSTRSADFTVTLGGATTTTALTTSSDTGVLNPGFVGATVEYRAQVSAATGAIPFGAVRFLRGSTLLSTVSLDASGAASLSLTADTAWSGDIVAEFAPGNGSFAASTARLAHSWIAAPVAVTLVGPPAATIGVAASFTASLVFDDTAYPTVPVALRPASAPSGTVTISDADGAACSVLVSSVPVTQPSIGSCDLPFALTGSRTVTATYAGDSSYAASTGTTATTVGKGAPQLALTPAAGGWLGLSTLPVNWAVTGPSSGSVVVKLGGATVCTSASLVGSCDVPLPRFGQSGGDTLTLEYSGTALWQAGSTTAHGVIVACVPFEQPAASPVGTAAVTVTPAPTCDSGRGYYTSTQVFVSVQAVAGYTVDRVTDHGLPYPADQIQFGEGRQAASLVVNPVLHLAEGQPKPFSVVAHTQATCVPVTFRVNGVAGRQLALSMLRWQADPACDGAPVATSDTTVVSPFRVGSTIPVAIEESLLPERRMFYGWQGQDGTDRFAPSTTFTVTAHHRELIATFGPVCYSGVPELTQPDGGVLSVTLPESNCTNPVSGARGWTYGTPGSGVLVDAEAASRFFFVGWAGDTARFTPGAAGTGTTAAGASTSVHPFTFPITETGFAVGATYGTCAAVTTEVVGDASEGVPGTVAVATAPNCPRGPGTATERWYRSGTTVELTATPTTGSALKFIGWSGLPVERSRIFGETVSFAVSQDTHAVASFGDTGNCRPFTLLAVPRDHVTLDTRFALGDNACAAIYGDRFYDQGTSGNAVFINPSPATPEAEGAEFVFAWATSPPGSPAGQSPTISGLWTTHDLNQELYGTTEIVAYACEYVAISARVHSPDGSIVADAGATNISRSSHTLLDDYVTTKPANCSIGADPRSGFGGYAWTVGTNLLPTVVADPLAYEFTGWSGDVAGTGATPDAALSLVGPGRRAEGDQYHYRVEANFTAICYTLDVPAVIVEVLTEPNCPGAEPGERRYLGGTNVVLHAIDHIDDFVFRGWVRGTDAVDGRWASVTMTSDKVVRADYTEKTLGEQLTEYGTLVGDQMAIASKKLVGVVSAATSAYVQAILLKATLVAQGVGYLAVGLEYAGVTGEVIDGMKSVSEAMSGIVSLLWAPLDCITAWSAGGDDTAFYAAQNFIGTTIVAQLSAGAQQEEPPGDSALDKLAAEAAKKAEAAKPVATAAQALLAAKEIYEAAAEGKVGWENSAHDAWATQASYEVYTQCMATKAGATMDAADASIALVP